MRSGSYVRSLLAINRNAKLFIMVSSGVAFCFFGIYGVLYNLFLIRLGFDSVFIGLANGVTGLGFALFSFPAGLIGGRIGYRRAMTIGASAGIVASSLLPCALFLSPGVQGPWLVFWYGMFGVAVSLILVNGVPFMMAWSTTKERSYVFAAAAAAPALGGFAGSVVAGLLPGLFASFMNVGMENARPYSFSLWAAPLVYMTILVAVRLMSPSSSQLEPEEVASRSAVPFVLILTCALIVFLRASIYFAFTAFFNVYLDTVFQSPSSTIGTLASLGRIAMAVGALLTPVLVSRLERHRSALLIAAVLVIFGSIAAAFRSLAFVTISLVGVAAATSAMDAVFNAFTQRIVPGQHRGMMSGAISLGAGLSFATTSYGGGFVVQSAGFQSLFLISSLLGLVAIVVLVLAFGTRRRAQIRTIGNS